MSKQTYSLATSLGTEEVEVEASEEAHALMYAMFRSIKHMRELISDLHSVQSHIKEIEGWAVSAIEKASLDIFIDEKRL